ncbi:BgTH12-00890 [Blumeria graminis f. sp. triticale]|uniref:BgTH12-00890 n=1 Tax=Blumeria graminis f. sp. triticale TaxID=1689686 RepID=A0A9W4D7D0_BLUGR|nr:BgTH12-00890 [Blumeria graminis f. sp. triticale]
MLCECRACPRHE